MSSRMQSRTAGLEHLEAKQVVAAAHAEAEKIIAEARRSAAEVYETERSRSVQRLTEVRDEYEQMSSQLRALKEATADMMTNALRDHQTIRRALDD